MENLINRIRGALSIGMGCDEIVEHFSSDFSIEDIFLAYTAARMLEG